MWKKMLSPPGGQHYKLLHPMVAMIHRQDQQASAFASGMMCGVLFQPHTIISYLIWSITKMQ